MEREKRGWRRTSRRRRRRNQGENEKTKVEVERKYEREREISISMKISQGRRRDLHFYNHEDFQLGCPRESSDKTALPKL